MTEQELLEWVIGLGQELGHKFDFDEMQFADEPLDGEEDEPD